MASDREKNIWPPAVARIEIRLGVFSMKPAFTAYPGTNMNLRPSPAFGRVQARMMIITSIIARAGIPTLLNFSIPPATPPMFMSQQMSIKSIMTPICPMGLVSIAPKDALEDGIEGHNKEGGYNGKPADPFELL